MTRAEYQSAYDAEFRHTVRSLLVRGAAASDAEDVAQAAWMRGWEKREALREPASVGAWIRTIALNILRSNFRQARKLEFLSEVETATSPQPIVSRIDARRALLRCAASDRALLEDLYLRGYTSVETARRHALTPGAVRVRTFRVKQRLQGLLRPSLRSRSEASTIRPAR
ncbi:MAG: sigma-70 family RNA polymerase sigma factor [Bryobacterales bacterium]